MLYLDFIDFQDLAEFAKGESLPFVRLDILDASVAGTYRFFLVATAPCAKQGVLAICSNLILEKDEPDLSSSQDPEKERAAFCAEMQAALLKAKESPAGVFSEHGLRVRPGVYSVEPPPVFRFRK